MCPTLEEHQGEAKRAYEKKEVEKTGVVPVASDPDMNDYLELERFKWAQKHFAKDKGNWVHFPLKVQLTKDAAYTIQIVGEGKIGVMTTDPYTCQGCESDTAWDFTFKTWIEGKEDVDAGAGKFQLGEDIEGLDIRTVFAILALVFAAWICVGSGWKYCRYLEHQKKAEAVQQKLRDTMQRQDADKQQTQLDQETLDEDMTTRRERD